MSTLNDTEILYSLKRKEAEVAELLKLKKKYEYEIETLREKYIEKDYRLKRTEEEYQKLKQKVKEMNSAYLNVSDSDVSGYILKLKEEIKILKEMNKKVQKDYKESLENETRRLSKLVIVAEKKNETLLKTLSPQSENIEQLLQKNAEISGHLTNSTRKIELLKTEIEKLQEEILMIKQENSYLIEENINFERKFNSSDINQLKIEADTIYKQSSDILLMIKGLKSQKDISQILVNKKIEIDNDFNKKMILIKKVLKDVKNLLIEIHTDMYREKICTPQ